MRTYPECMECFDRTIRYLAEKHARNKENHQKILKTALDAAAAFDPELPPPTLARETYKIIADLSGKPDAYEQEKHLSTIAAKQLLETLLSEESIDLNDFETRVRLAIAGNIIDFGVNTQLNLDTAKQIILDSFEKPVNRDNMLRFQEKIESANNILYLLDNCGEAVFDKILMEPYGEKITLCTRGFPVLNDVTRKELEMSGLNGITKQVIDTGDYTPGITLEKSSGEFLSAFREADLIIAKGQGNYETLSDRPEPIIFLFMAKCLTVCKHLNDKINSLQVRFSGENL